MVNRPQPLIQTFCQLWYEGRREPVIVKAHYEFMWFASQANMKTFQPYLISCKAPKSKRIPASVSLVESRCDISTTNLEVIFNQAEDEVKNDFAVCVKGLEIFTPKTSVRLVEWIETILLLGANEIFFYEFFVHPEVKKVLDYYAEDGTISVTPLTLAGYTFKTPGLQHFFFKKNLTQKRINEIIPYNDCFYKNMYRYKFVVMLDIDEIVMPMNDDDLSWLDLKKRTIDVIMRNKKQKNTHYNVRNVYFFDEPQEMHGIPNFMHMLNHVHRTVNHTKPGFFIKSFFDSDRILIAHNHYPLKCLNGPCKSFPLSIKDVQLQHYREDCVGELAKQCAEMKRNIVKDATIWKLKDKLWPQVEEVVRVLNLLEDENV